MELTILMPCLNEEKTVGTCVEIAAEYIHDHNIDGEVLVVDNGSTDASAAEAARAGAVVEPCADRGYGNALRFGMKCARGKYIIMGDCDMSYDFSALDSFMKCFRSGAELVIGDRMHKDMIPGSMPWTHRYIGVPFLSMIGRRRYHTDVHDFHCGLRGIRKDTADGLTFTSEGMEFASEMIGVCARAGCRIEQVPVELHPDGRSGHSHLNAVRDGIRHLKVMSR